VKKVIVLAMVFAFMLAYTTPVMAMPEPMEKLKDGTIEVLKAPLQLPDHLVKSYDDHDNKIFGFFDGLAKGTIHTVDHASKGLYKMVTFPLK